MPWYIKGYHMLKTPFLVFRRYRENKKTNTRNGYRMYRKSAACNG